MTPSKTFETPEASGFSRVEQSFVERQWELGVAFSNEYMSDYHGEDAYIFTEPALTTFIETVIKNTLEEVRVLFSKYNKEEELDDVAFMNEVNSVLAEMVHPLTHTEG